MFFGEFKGDVLVDIIFVNFVDFDMFYGYCWDVVGYVKVLEEFDFYFLILFDVL